MTVVVKIVILTQTRVIIGSERLQNWNVINFIYTRRGIKDST